MFPTIASGCVLTSKMIVTCDSGPTSVLMWSWSPLDNEYLIVQRGKIFGAAGAESYSVRVLHDKFDAKPDKIWIQLQHDEKRCSKMQERNTDYICKYRTGPSMLFRVWLNPANILNSPIAPVPGITSHILSFTQISRDKIVIAMEKSIKIARLTGTIWDDKGTYHNYVARITSQTRPMNMRNRQNIF